MISNFSPSSALWDGAGVAMGTAPQSAVPRRINSYLSNKYRRSLFVPRLHPPGAAKWILLRRQKPQCELPGGEGSLSIEVPQWVAESSPCQFHPGGFGQQTRPGFLQSQQQQKGLCVPQTELPSEIQPSSAGFSISSLSQLLQGGKSCKISMRPKY